MPYNPHNSPKQVQLFLPILQRITFLKTYPQIHSWLISQNLNPGNLIPACTLVAELPTCPSIPLPATQDNNQWDNQDSIAGPRKHGLNKAMGENLKLQEIQQKMRRERGEAILGNQYFKKFAKTKKKKVSNLRVD